VKRLKYLSIESLVAIIQSGEVSMERQTNNSKLHFIKLVHTVVWFFFNAVILYMLYAAWTDKIDIWLWVCYGIILLEGLTLLIFKLYCPLTLWARKYSDSDKENFDIYLPNWLAKYNKQIYTSIIVGITVIVIIRLLQ